MLNFISGLESCTTYCRHRASHQGHDTVRLHLLKLDYFFWPKNIHLSLLVNCAGPLGSENYCWPYTTPVASFPVSSRGVQRNKEGKKKEKQSCAISISGLNKKAH